MVKIGHASIDERGRANSGLAGDQTKREVFIRGWYNHPWYKVIRPKDPVDAEKIASAMEQACNNDYIGYDQYQRTTLYNLAKSLKWNISKVNTPCETDCSALVSVCVNAAGIQVSKDMYTGNEEMVLFKTGKFTILSDLKYVASDKSLKRGDILLGRGHTAIVLTDSEAKKTIKNSAPKEKSKTNSFRVKVTTDSLNVRRKPNVTQPIVDVLYKGDEVDVLRTSSNNWGFVLSKKGWISLKYVIKI